jgi:hypothetical protein
MAIFALSLLLMASCQASAQEATAAAPGQNYQNSGEAQTPAVPLDQLVTATCRQAWRMGGKTQEGFFALVQELTALSAHNRGVTLPDDKSAGARAGEWIRTQAMKDPDQLLYVVADQAVQHSIAEGRATKTPAAAPGASPAQN